ncbi:hypothetical protein TpMuguga_01g00995 [Theileria parva strain Muguga]|uniref:Uncharacterized protein n=1 Tax=Theileria parva TaxID=5875 RepID=Q4N725_THEPA|nr:uncharacterized protein TpMuguga_01g00995 [Theileria parva strain Muguga]EAN34233.1 hypothetical protein TpMuguga_01g00995 [Theileria parva strain Muguga]|eukprot:XP_766516.1 hypothetical protein [Theileria parva strain Muguga]
MENDLRSKATSIFNNLNRFLNLLNFKDSNDPSSDVSSIAQLSDSKFSLSDPNNTKNLENYLTNIPNGFSDNFNLDCDFSTIVYDILLEEDVIGLGLKPSYYTNLSRLGTEDSLLTSKNLDLLEEDDPNIDYELISNLSSDGGGDSDEDSFLCSVDSNFVNYTYWSVETGENVSSTSRPTYYNAKNCKVSLLQEAEAFVAEALWGSDNNLFRFTPRHLLLQSAQIANRAFFDPDYRKYLQLNYV